MDRSGVEEIGWEYEMTLKFAHTRLSEHIKWFVADAGAEGLVGSMPATLWPSGFSYDHDSARPSTAGLLFFMTITQKPKYIPAAWCR